ncbi:MAG: hypothetical protein R3E39_17145 [Anaerolineae bacterium]
MRNLRLILFLLLLFPALVVHAQDATCDFDIGPITSLLETAQVEGANGNITEARRLLHEAGLILVELNVNCKDKVDLSAEKTIQLSHDGVNGELTFNYPAGWVTGEEQAEDFPNILIGSDPAALDKPLNGSKPPTFNSGEALIALGVMNTSMFGMPELGDAPKPADFIQQLLKSGADELGTPSEVTTRTLNDHPAAWVTFTNSSDFGLLLMIMDMKLKLPDGSAQYVLLMGITSADEYPALQPTLESMAETIRLRMK